MEGHVKTSDDIGGKPLILREEAWFGFVPASRFGLRCEYDAPDEAFMALELVPGSLAGVPGLVRYRPEFAAVG